MSTWGYTPTEFIERVIERADDRGLDLDEAAEELCKEKQIVIVREDQVRVSPREFKQKVSDALREKHPRPSEYGDIPQAWEVFACMNEVIADLEGEGMKAC